MIPDICSQADMQNHLAAIAKTQRFPSALDALFEWSKRVGYLTDAKLNDNLRYTYFDPTLNIHFKTQINIARSRYSPLPPTGKDLPKLHCSICFENIGLPGKEQLRAFEFELNGKNFFAQLTPFPLYPKHFVLVSREQTPMIMNAESIADMLNFLDKAPRYTVLSNSDIEWAGASILAHHHYQTIENLKLPITEAHAFTGCQKKIGQTQIQLLNFPIATFRLDSPHSEELSWYGQKILAFWRAKDPKNTCNLMLLHTHPHQKSLFILLRNPAYRTPESLLAIKSEGVGIVEVCGEGIYPIPQDPAIAHRIEREGLSVIKGIINGNNPLPSDQFLFIFDEILSLLN
jgi:UDPglucose--hexose-1-phosphate uridylyltransferase